MTDWIQPAQYRILNSEAGDQKTRVHLEQVHGSKGQVVDCEPGKRKCGNAEMLGLCWLENSTKGEPAAQVEATKWQVLKVP